MTSVRHSCEAENEIDVSFKTAYVQVLTGEAQLCVGCVFGADEVDGCVFVHGAGSRPFFGPQYSPIILENAPTLVAVISNHEDNYFGNYLVTQLLCRTVLLYIYRVEVLSLGLLI